MPRVQDLSPAVRKEIEDFLGEHNFSRYSELTNRLRGRGVQLSRSALHRYGMKVRAERITAAAQRLADRREAEQIERRIRSIAKGVAGNKAAERMLEKVMRQFLDPASARRPANGAKRARGRDGRAVRW